MRKINLAILIMLCMSLIGCGKQEKDTPTSANVDELREVVVGLDEKFDTEKYEVDTMPTPEELLATVISNNYSFNFTYCITTEKDGKTIDKVSTSISENTDTGAHSIKAYSENEVVLNEDGTTSSNKISDTYDEIYADYNETDGLYYYYSNEDNWKQHSAEILDNLDLVAHSNTELSSLFVTNMEYGEIAYADKTFLMQGFMKDEFTKSLLGEYYHKDMKTTYILSVDNKKNFLNIEIAVKAPESYVVNEDTTCKLVYLSCMLNRMDASLEVPEHVLDNAALAGDVVLEEEETYFGNIPFDDTELNFTEGPVTLKMHDNLCEFNLPAGYWKYTKVTDYLIGYADTDEHNNYNTIAWYYDADYCMTVPQNNKTFLSTFIDGTKDVVSIVKLNKTNIYYVERTTETGKHIVALQPTDLMNSIVIDIYTNDKTANPVDIFKVVYVN